MADVSCKVEKILQIKDQPNLTVGEKFKLQCDGAWPKMDPAKLELRLDEADKNKLKFFDFNSTSATSADLIVTSYVVGKHEFKAAQLVDSQNSVLLNDLKFEVVSVQNPKEPIKEPFSPQGPLTFFPWSFVFAVVLLASLVLAAVAFQMFRRRHRSKLMQQVDAKVFQYPPVPEFYRLVRQLQRHHLFLTDPKVPTGDTNLVELLQQFDEHFRVFITRVYRLPAHSDPSKKVLSELNERGKMDPILFAELQKTLRELDRAKAVPERITGADLAQLLRLMKNVVDLTAKHNPVGRGGAV